MRLIAALCIGLLPALLAAKPPAQSSTTPSTASQPSPEQLEQARIVFRQLKNTTLTDTDKTRIERLIANLGSGKWQQREDAKKALKSESIAAMPMIRAAMDDKDIEVASQAREIIEFFEKKKDPPSQLREAIAIRRAAADPMLVGDLIALLLSDELSFRSIAGVSLHRLAGQNFGYDARAEAEQRQIAAQKAEQWWGQNHADFRFGPEWNLVLDLDNGVSMDLVYIPAGTFRMGSAGETEGEGPQHEVTITKPFYMSASEVTQAQYEKVMGKNPSLFKKGNFPVEGVLWPEAEAFCKELSRQTGRTVSLPTEAQWEYACRADSTTDFFFGDDEAYYRQYGWSSEEKPGAPQPVRQKKPNEFGLYDMHGNVWEWCADWYSDSYESGSIQDPRGPVSGPGHVLRGGGWNVEPYRSRSAFRHMDDSQERLWGLYGFRVVVEVK